MIEVQDKNITLSNPEKILWPELGIRKMDYFQILAKLAPYILLYSKKRLLTTIRYPDGIEGKSFYQKNIPQYAPKWIHTEPWKDTTYIILDDEPTLLWLGNLAAIEFHTSFHEIGEAYYPTSLVFDLDPSEGQPFDMVVEIALKIHETLESLKIDSFVKTSGATGVQIYLPIAKKYNYDEARSLNEFFAKYFSEKYPGKITIERMVDKRGKKLYFDYLQMWEGKTIITPYSPRANKNGCVSMPVEWEELEKGVQPNDFTLINVFQRLEEKGDLFQRIVSIKNKDSIARIYSYVKKGV